MKTALLLSSAVVLAALAAAVAWSLAASEPPARALSTFPSAYPVRGIDVSHHNGVIDWQQVASSGITFVYVKASEGGDVADARFASNVTAARGAGLKVGAYHFFTFCRAGEDQARQFLSVTKPMAGDLPPAVDVEFVGNCRAPPAAAVVRENLERWLELVENSLGRKPIIYSTPDAAEAFLAGLPNLLWMRVLPGEPKENWSFWQFDPSGTVPGIDGDVDLNVFRGDRAALEAL